jgi:hypothetical protein
MLLRAAVPKLTQFMVPLVSQQSFRAPLDQMKHLTFLFIKQLGPKNLITICPKNLVAV